MTINSITMVLKVVETTPKIWGWEITYNRKMKNSET